MLNNPVIKKLIEAGISITFQEPQTIFSGANTKLEKEGVKMIGAVEGFYKSSYVYLCEFNNELHCIARYGEDEGIITSIDDLARINLEWWEYSQSKGWKQPEDFWLPHLIRLGLVDVETKQIITPKSGTEHAE